MNKIGTNHGGWDIPHLIDINTNSIIYSGGVGEDISFDLILSHKYNSKIYLIDPTKKSLQHLKEIKQFYNTKEWKFSGNISKDYKKQIFNLTPNFDKITYIDIGLWNSKTKLKFYKQNNPKYVSQSIIPDMFGTNYDIIYTKTIKQIMDEYNHDKIDLLKLDIEGAEIEVLEQMLKDNIYPRYLCIEFDLFLKKKDKYNKTHFLINKLIKKGYTILKNRKYNITFKLV